MSFATWCKIRLALRSGVSAWTTAFRILPIHASVRRGVLIHLMGLVLQVVVLSLAVVLAEVVDGWMSCCIVDCEERV
ncbi:hypothetical protein BDV12DRAFT_159011 [Aspergillus spectabilis]